MMKVVSVIFYVVFGAFFCAPSLGQKIIGDCTITYGLQTQSDEGIDANLLRNASKIFYVRGGMSLTETRFKGYLQSTIYNKNGDKAYILYEMGGEKYMSILSNKQWLAQYKKYKDLKVNISNEHKKILGYRCTKAIVTLRDGTKIKLYFTPKLKTTVAENPYEFDKIDGLVLEYEAQVGGKYNITYTAKSINFSPVPAAKFIIPTQGYRLLDANKSMLSQ